MIHNHSRINYRKGRTAEDNPPHNFSVRILFSELLNFHDEYVEEARVWGECTCSAVAVGSIITYSSESVIIIDRETSVGSEYHSTILWYREWNYCRTVVVACLFYDLDRDLVGQDHPTAILCHRRRRRSKISPNGIV